jgi:hypothetical protein
MQNRIVFGKLIQKCSETLDLKSASHTCRMSDV